MASKLALVPSDEDFVEAFKEGVVKALGPAGPPLLPLLVPEFVRVLTRVRPDGNSAELISVGEAARRLGIGRTKTYELIDRGQIPTVKIGKRRLVPPEAVDALKARLLGDSEVGERRKDVPA